VRKYGKLTEIKITEKGETAKSTIEIRSWEFTPRSPPAPAENSHPSNQISRREECSFARNLLKRKKGEKRKEKKRKRERERKSKRITPPSIRIPYRRYRTFGTKGALAFFTATAFVFPLLFSPPLRAFYSSPFTARPIVPLKKRTPEGKGTRKRASLVMARAGGCHSSKAIYLHDVASDPHFPRRLTPGRDRSRWWFPF